MSDQVLRSEESPTSRRSPEAAPKLLNENSPVRGLSGSRQLSNTSKTTVNQDSNVLIVDWDGPDDPSNPKNWSFKKTWRKTAIVPFFAFTSLASSSILAPVSSQVAAEFAITNDAVVALTISIFVLAQAFGPLVLSPMSELYGRSRVLQAGNAWFLVWNLGCGFAQNEGQLIAFRFLAGLGGSAALSIAGGVISDTWLPEERGMASGVFSLVTFLGPAIGPMTGSWIAEKTEWRWVFWATSIFDSILLILTFFCLGETYPPVLLERKAEAIKRTLGDPEKGEGSLEVKTIYTSPDRHWKVIFKKALTRPSMFFAQELIIQIAGLYMMFAFGLLYIFLTTVPDIFRKVYQETDGIAGLNYIALGIGITGASQASGVLMDKYYAKLKQEYGTGKPEFRLLYLFPTGLLIPIGLLITGWTAEYKLHWMGADIGLVLVGAGIVLVIQGVQTYVIDSYGLHAASALAAVFFLRSVAGFGFPVFAPKLFQSLGYGMGNTVLAAVAVGIGIPAPILFWKFGERIRNASTHCVKTPPRMNT